MIRTRYNLVLFLIITQILLLQVNSLRLTDRDILSSRDYDGWVHNIHRRDAQATTPKTTIGKTNNNNTNQTVPLKCNGDATICDLRYDQVTHPGTHNSGSYDLRIDCNQTVRSCLNSVNVCSRQYAQCVVSYGMQCNAQTSAFKQRSPEWLFWALDKFNNTCKSSNAVCAAWNAVCTNSDKVCNVWGHACEVNIPGWIITCFWENNPGYPVLRQLNDGIRLFDIDTCLVDNERAVNCHGMGLSRALGGELDETFTTILNFMIENPNEVITMEFGDIDGDAVKISNYIQSKLVQYFMNETTGHSLIYTSKDPNNPWITLREMIKNNTRIVIFFGRIYDNVENRQPWIHSTREWFYESFSYTSNDMTAEQITNAFTTYCASNDTVIRDDMQSLGRVRWQTIDNTVGILPPEVHEALRMGKNPSQLCLKDLALAINFDVLKNIASFCYPRFPYFFRVRVDSYWQSSLFEVVRILNEQNVKKFLNKTIDPNQNTTTTTNLKF